MRQVCKLAVLLFSLMAFAQETKVTLPSGTGRPFDVTKHVVPLEELLGGGPPKDGIPSLDHPKFVSTEAARRFLSPDDRVLGVFVDGTAKAYPVKILNWHEIVNDEIGGRPITVTWCPLCVSGVVYDPRVNGTNLIFGVSGKLYKSSLVMYDRQTESLWSQIRQEAIAGPMTGAKLQMIPALNTTWKEWAKQHPQAAVLSPDTGFHRNYGLNPYATYYENGIPSFRKGGLDSRAGLRAMEKVLGVQSNGITKAYPFRFLKENAPQFQDQLGNTTVTVKFDVKSETAFVLDQSGQVVPSMVTFWFAWQDFYPSTLLATSKR